MTETNNTTASPSIDVLFLHVNKILADPLQSLANTGTPWITKAYAKLLEDGGKDAFAPFRVEDTLNLPQQIKGMRITVQMFETACKHASSPAAERILAPSVAMHLLRERYKWQFWRGPDCTVPYLTMEWSFNCSNDYRYSVLKFSQLKSA